MPSQPHWYGFGCVGNNGQRSLLCPCRHIFKTNKPTKTKTKTKKIECFFHRVLPEQTLSFPLLLPGWSYQFDECTYALTEIAIMVSHTSRGEMMNKSQTALSAAPSEKDCRHVFPYMSSVTTKENGHPSCQLSAFWNGGGQSHQNDLGWRKNIKDVWTDGSWKFLNFHNHICFSSTIILWQQQIWTMVCSTTV